jgi:hypothetical protein
MDEFEGLKRYDGRYDHLKIVSRPVVIWVEEVVEVSP